MQIQIKNIWTIKEASINLDWLSVIAWNNDTWKSTVSKVIFSVIKAFQQYKDFKEVSKENIITNEIENIYRETRFINSLLSDKEYASFFVKNYWEIFKDLQKEFTPIQFIEWLELNPSHDFFEAKRIIIKDLKFKDILKQNLYKGLDKIEKEYFKEETKEYLIEKALNNIFDSEFRWWLSFGNKKWKIIATDWTLPLFNIEIKNNKIENIKIVDDIIKIKDSTFTETPIILNLFNDLDGMQRLQFHVQDLFKKIRKIDVKNSSRKNWFWLKVENIIWWKFELNKKIAWVELSFNKKWVDWNIHTINTATWIKSFGILDLLDQADNLNSDSLLILDEPEVHLHPEWQVRYAELIILLIKERDLSVLITSHSPYMIKALSKFSKEKDKVNASFYLAEKNKNWGFNINDKTNDINIIFEKLAEPFNILMKQYYVVKTRKILNY